VTLNLAETSVAKSRPSVPYGANLFVTYYCLLGYWPLRAGVKAANVSSQFCQSRKHRWTL